ncbi:pH regulation protein F [Candidatus Marinamargulisbacteria bacterium SCGC AG-410-N11]|nr:pH regulation protein F [Candidatus Marinamargulisbacteria bacterium SCGC AG-410-N11]
MMVVFYRVLKGPTVMDRLLGVNVIGTKATVLLVVMGVIFERVDMFVDIAIGYGLLNFIASIGAAKYFQHHKVLQPRSQWEEDLTKS